MSKSHTVILTAKQMKISVAIILLIIALVSNSIWVWLPVGIILGYILGALLAGK